MESINWATLPIEVMYLVFHQLPIQSVLYTIPKVCQEWQEILDQVSYWWDRLHYEGLHVRRKHRLDLIKNIDPSRIIHLLQETRLLHAETLSPSYTQADDFDDGGIWMVSEQQVTLSSICLLFRSPRVIIIDILSKASDVKDLDILLLQLSHCDCQVHLKDRFSWNMTDPLSTSEMLLKYLVRDDIKCKLNSFCGSIESINNLPKSIERLSIAITKKTSGNAIDPGIEHLKDAFPALKELRFFFLTTFPNTKIIKGIQWDAPQG